MENREREPQYYADIIAAMAERTIKRLWVLCIILALLLAASWAGFLLFESQFECVTETTQEVTQSADGTSFNKFVGGDILGSYADS